MIRALFRLLRLQRDLKAARKGPAALGKRQVRRKAYKSLSRALRRF